MIGVLFLHTHFWAGNNFSLLLSLVVVLLIIGLLIFSHSRKSISSRNIGDISTEIGYDARDLRVAGYSWQEIEGVVNGEYSLETLLARGPAAKRKKRK